MTGQLLSDMLQNCCVEHECSEEQFWQGKVQAVLVSQSKIHVFDTTLIEICSLISLLPIWAQVKQIEKNIRSKGWICSSLPPTHNLADNKHVDRFEEGTVFSCIFFSCPVGKLPSDQASFEGELKI